MEKEKVLEVLKRLGWKPAPPGYPAFAYKRFGEQEAWAWYQGGRLTFDFYSCNRNVVEGACCIPRSEEDVIKTVRYAEKKIGESFYMRFLAR